MSDGWTVDCDDYEASQEKRHIRDGDRIVARALSRNDAMRICACINACRGLSDAEVKRIPYLLHEMDQEADADDGQPNDAMRYLNCLREPNKWAASKGHITEEMEGEPR